MVLGAPLPLLWSVLLFRAPFDRSVIPIFGRGPLESRGLRFVEEGGKWALFVGEGTRLSYPVEGNLDKRRGTVCMWVRPAWDGDDGKNHAFFADDLPFPQKGANSLYLWKWSVGLLRFDVRDPGDHYITFDVKGWRAGEWHHIAAAWDSEEGTWLFVDGRLVAHKGFKWEPKTGRKFYVGLNWAGSDPAEAAVRDLRIYAIPLTEGQVEAVMEGKRLAPLEYLGLRAPGRITVGRPFPVEVAFRAPEGLSGRRKVRVLVDGVPVGEFEFSPARPVPPGGRGRAGPFEVSIPWWLHLPPGEHVLSATIGGALGLRGESASKKVRVSPSPRRKGPPRVEVTGSGEVLLDGKPFLVRKPGYGFFFEGRFYPAESREAARLAAELARSGRIVDALRCRLIDFLDCSKTDHGYKETAPAKVVEITLADGERRKFRITGDPEKVTETRLVYGRKRRVLPAFSYVLKCAPRPVPHLLVIESVNDAERYLEVAVDALPPFLPHLRGAGAARWVVNLAVAYTGREECPPDRRPFVFPILFFPKSERIEVTISSSGRERERGPLSGAAVSRIWVYELLDPLPELANPIEFPKRGPRRTVALFYPHAPNMFDEFGFSSRSPELRRSGARALMDYLRFVGINCLQFHPYAFDTRAFFKSRLFPQIEDFAVFDEVLPAAREAGIEVVPRVDSLVFFDKALEDDPLNFQWGTDGKIRQYFGKVPDPLRPPVQKLLLDVLAEMLERTKGYRNVPGVGFRANGKFGVLFVGSHWEKPPQESGYSEWDVEQFSRETGIRLPPLDTPKERYLWLKEHAWERWISWRCEKIRDWWLKARDLTKAHGKLLFVMTVIPYDHHFPSEKTQWYGRGLDPLTIHRYHGYDPALFREVEGMVISWSIPIGADRYFRRSHNRAWWHEPSLPALYRTREGSAVELYFIYWELPNHPKGFRVGPSSPAGRAFLEPFTYAMRTMNPRWVVLYNWFRATLGRELLLRQFCRAFLALPAVPPRPFDGRVEPPPDERLWIKWFGERLAIVNDANRSLTVKLTIPRALPKGHRLVDLATNETLLAAEGGPVRPIKVALRLRPFDLRTLAILPE